MCYYARAQSYVNRSQLYRAGPPAATRWLAGRARNFRSDACMLTLICKTLTIFVFRAACHARNGSYLRGGCGKYKPQYTAVPVSVDRILLVWPGHDVLANTGTTSRVPVSYTVNPLPFKDLQYMVQLYSYCTTQHNVDWHLVFFRCGPAPGRPS